ncbi:hypothetical protein OGATHE_006577 [Ogataea polymorpha]|uniref:Uncharacterized protein n=1 Tax=Ogataea polymorpha TaxID=460523 RepID=A0A9P8SYU5_9ASCO|nr:hypothetical protein OGATHE_006577 [Ogataea polymorpha]
MRVVVLVATAVQLREIAGVDFILQVEPLKLVESFFPCWWQLARSVGQARYIDVKTGGGVDEPSVNGVVAITATAVMKIRTHVQQIASRAVDVHDKRLVVVTCKTQQTGLGDLDVEVEVPIEDETVELVAKQRSVG